MQFPLDLMTITLWLASTAIILLVTSEIVSQHYGKNQLLINKKRLRNVALVMSTLFLLSVIFHIYEIIVSS